jgi:predicted DNA-binding antitoxin AbrB/MazE fold protein
MTHTVDATYENGTLKLAHPLPLKPNEAVRVTVETQVSPLLQAYGILGWKGDHDSLQRLIEESEFDLQERA